MAVPSGRLASATAALLLLSALASASLIGSRQTAPVGSSPSRPVATDEEVAARCGTACHALPPPDILPRSAWRDELVRMMLIQEGIPEPAGASRVIPLLPDWLPLLRYYEARAPERLSDPTAWPVVDMARLGLTPRSLAPPTRDLAVAVSNVRFLDIDADGRLDVVASDMRSGPVFAGLARHDFALAPIAQLRHPAHIEHVDLDEDGLKDLLVADLGSYLPADHSDGAVYWLRRRKDTFDRVLLASGLARVADARAADFDGDGDLDIILGVFGWRRTGNITLLENRTTDWASPSFVAKVIDTRTGTIHVPVTDVNGDGRPDFVALLAQEHESVVAFINTGAGLEFRPQTLYAAPHPNWGSSGIELVDLDRDGDEDVLLTHGDTFDDFIIKPYHGIQWLENTGGQRYKAHSLAQLPGAQRAQAADLDRDGDLDIVASAMIAGGEITPQLASLVWLEQVKPRVFERRTLELGSPYHATLDVADYNGDGRPDIAVGWFAVTSPRPASIDLWTSGRK
jgi:hypothetical protein